MKHIILCYRRKSQVRDKADLISPQRQTVAVEAAVTLLEGQFLCEWYEDVEGHRSGRTEQGRPGWLQLKEQLKRADVEGVACYSLSRIYRNVKEFLAFVEELNRLDLRLIVVKERIDTHTPTGLAIMTILMAMYQLESDLAASRMTDTIAFKRQSLKHHWGPIPFGCIRDKETCSLAPDPDKVYMSGPEGKIIERSYHCALKRAYKLYATGNYTYDGLTIALNDELWQYKDRYGNQREFTRDDVRRILNLWRIYRGSLTLGRNRDEDVVEIPNAHSPILDPELCLKVAEQLKVRSNRHQKRMHHQHMLSGLLVCAECGKRLYGSTRHNLDRYYLHRDGLGKCSQTWQLADAIEDAAIQAVAALCPDEKIPVLRARIAARGSVPDIINEQYVLLSENESALDRLAELYLDNAISRDRYNLQNQRLNDQITYINKVLEQLETGDAQSALARLHIISTEITTLPQSQQREQLMAAFSAINLRDGIIEGFTPKPWLLPIWEDVIAKIYAN